MDKRSAQGPLDYKRLVIRAQSKIVQNLFLFIPFHPIPHSLFLSMCLTFFSFVAVNL